MRSWSVSEPVVGSTGMGLVLVLGLFRDCPQLPSLISFRRSVQSKEDPSNFVEQPCNISKFTSSSFFFGTTTVVGQGLPVPTGEQ